MLTLTPIAVDEPPLFRGKRALVPPYSATVIGASVVLRLYGGGLGGLSFALTTIPFPTANEAEAWIAAHRA